MRPLNWPFVARSIESPKNMQSTAARRTTFTLVRMRAIILLVYPRFDAGTMANVTRFPCSRLDEAGWYLPTYRHPHGADWRQVNGSKHR